MNAIGEPKRGVTPGAVRIGGNAAEQRRAVVDVNRAVDFGIAGQRQRVVVGDEVPGTPVSAEIPVTAAATGAAVSTVTASAVEATLTLPAASVAVVEKLCRPSGSGSVV